MRRKFWWSHLNSNSLLILVNPSWGNVTTKYKQRQGNPHLGMCPVSPIFLIPLTRRGVGFIRGFLLSNEMVMWFFSFSFFILWDYIVRFFFLILNHSPGMNFTWSGWMTFWCVLGIDLWEFYKVFCVSVHNQSWSVCCLSLFSLSVV